jgi:hypothetical protein
MATTIKFDTTEIANTTYNPQFVKHESNPDRILTALQLTREDGEILIADKFGIKKIPLKGILVGSSQADLESKINTFKELFSRQEKNLDIDWNSGTMRYVATCTKHEFDRDHFNILFVPWTAEFTILSGEGKNTSVTTVLNDHSVVTTTPGADSFSMLGTKPAKPEITLTVRQTLVRGIEYKNTDNNEKIVITKAAGWTGIDWDVVIDCLNKKVTELDTVLGGLAQEIKFYGTFPKFRIGTNNVLITLGGIICQQSPDTLAFDKTDGQILDDTAKRYAESFSIPYTDGTFKGIILNLEKEGSPGTITVRIETDNGNKPSGTLAHANATMTIPAGDVIDSVPSYVTAYSASLWGLTANTKYWIVISAAGVAGADKYCVGQYPGYPSGKGMKSTDSGSTYTDLTTPLSFRILYGGKPEISGVLHTVKYTKTYL